LTFDRPDGPDRPTGLFAVFFYGLVVGVKGTDVEASGGHGPGVHGGMVDHVVGEVARGILATAVLHGVADEVEVFLEVDIEGGDGPVALGDLGLLFHAEDAVVGVELYDACALELLDGGLLVAHDAGGLFLLGESHELGKAEEEEVVGGDHQQVVIDMELIHCEKEVTDGAKTGVVGLCAIINDGDGFPRGGTARHGKTLISPLLEDVGELVVGDDDVLINLGDRVDIIEHATQDGVGTYLEQGLGEVLGELT